MRIYQIEITNKCNLKCDYCPRSKMKRPLGVMTYQTLKAVLDTIENKTLRLHHYGESLLDKELESKIKFIKKYKPNLTLILNTNGLLLTKKRTNDLFKAGLDYIILSYHNEKSIQHIKTLPKEFRNRIEITKMSNKKENLGKYKDMGYQVSIKRLRNLGQVKKTKKLKGSPVDRCAFLKKNEVVVLWNGDIVPCCECYDDSYVLSNVNLKEVVDNQPFLMCHTCLGYGNDESETERF